jgi:hypothetical protein
MPEAVQKLLADQMIENTDKRVFYVKNAGTSRQYYVSVPGRDGKGRCHAAVTFQPAKVKDETAKQVALTIGPVK